MFIAFEGPDKTGKSTTAAELASDGVAIYNVTKDIHRVQQEALGQQPDDVITYDRIDWLSHMVYRLAMPTYEWNDDRPRTVFAMPDTHLVLKMHHPMYVDIIEDELYEAGRLAPVNEMYFHQISFLMDLNKSREYSLFKSITIVEVAHDPRTAQFSQRVMDHDSPGLDFGSALARVVDTNDRLLGFLRHVDQHIG